MSPSRWTICAIAALVFAAPLAAQRPGTVEIGGFGQWTWFDDNAGRPNAVPENGLGYGGRLGVFVTPRWQIEGDGYFSPQSRKLTEEFCCLGLFPTDVNASAFALRLNYNVPLALMGGRTRFILGGGAVRTSYSFEGGNAGDSSVSNFGASGLAGLRLAFAKHVALRFDGVVDYMPKHEPDANMNLHARAGVSFLLGGSDRAISVVAPPLPPVAMPTSPPPPRAPVENAITVCVIDPSQVSGIRVQNAFYRVEQRDTVVIQGDNRVPMSQVSGNARIARDADWYTGGEPLRMTVGKQSVRYMTFQGARQIDPNSISYIGNINGYPAYADRHEVAGILTALNEARAADPNRDLGALLAERRDLREAIEDVKVLYVPLQRTDCIFQPMQIMEQVTKGMRQ